MTFPAKQTVNKIQLNSAVSPSVTNVPHINIETNIDLIRNYLLNSPATYFEFDQDAYVPASKNFNFSGAVVKVKGGADIVAGGTVTLTVSVTNYIQYNPDTTLVINSTSGFSTRNIPIWSVTLDGSGNITAQQDYRGTLNSSVTSATLVDYDNTSSGLTATTSQAAIDEIDGRLDTAESNISTLSSSSTKLKISAADTTEDYLTSKLSAGTNVSLAILNPGANEQLQISVTGTVATANNALNLNSQLPSYYLDLANHTGTISDSQHGNRSGGALHADVIASGASGFMTGSDKAKLDGLITGQRYIGGLSGDGTSFTTTSAWAQVIQLTTHVDIGGLSIPNNTTKVVTAPVGVSWIKVKAYILAEFFAAGPITMAARIISSLSPTVPVAEVEISNAGEVASDIMGLYMETQIFSAGAGGQTYHVELFQSLPSVTISPRSYLELEVIE